MEEHRRRIDRVLEPAYLEGIASRPIDEVRVMRAECSEIETEVSYVRRLAQARLDILHAELDRRAAGGSLGDLIAALPQILAGDAPRTAPATSRLAQPLAPSMEIQWSRGLERLVADATLANLPNLADDELRSTIEQLGDLEVEVSEVRHRLHAVMDALERELANRLKVGQA
jgi:hypothetical protein